MKSYARFRKLLGSARSLVVGSLSMLMLAALFFLAFPGGRGTADVRCESEATLFRMYASLTERVRRFRRHLMCSSVATRSSAFRQAQLPSTQVRG